MKFLIVLTLRNMSSDRAIEEMINVPALEPAKPCRVCSTRMKELQFTTSKKKASIFFLSSGEVASWPIPDI